MNRYLLLLLVASSTTIQADPPALSNCGNTCFMNASLQLLYRIRPLTDALVAYSNGYPYKQHPETLSFKKLFNNELSQKDVKSYFQNSYVQLMRAFQAGDKPGVSIPFTCADDSWLKKVDFLGYALMGAPTCSMDDARQFITEALSALDDQSQKKAEFKFPLQDILSVTKSNKIMCAAIGTNNFTLESSRKESPGLSMILELQKGGTPLTTLTQCFDYFAEPELVEGYRPGKTCYKQMFIDSSREYLLVALNRFDWEGNKLAHSVFVDEQINLKKYFFDQSTSEADSRYTLVGVSVHSGTLAGGHYWAYIQDASGQWFRCDDERISKVSFTDAGVQRDISQAYVLLYQRSKNVIAAPRGQNPQAPEVSPGTLVEKKPFGEVSAREAQITAERQKKEEEEKRKAAAEQERAREEQQRARAAQQCIQEEQQKEARRRADAQKAYEEQLKMLAEQERAQKDQQRSRAAQQRTQEEQQKEAQRRFDEEKAAADKDRLEAEQRIREEQQAAQKAYEEQLMAAEQVRTQKERQRIQEEQQKTPKGQNEEARRKIYERKAADDQAAYEEQLKRLYEKQNASEKADDEKKKEQQVLIDNLNAFAKSLNDLARAMA